MKNDNRFNRMLFETLPIGLAVCDMEGRLFYVNQAYASIIGYSIKEVLNLTYWEITPTEFDEQEQEQLVSLEKTGCYGPYEKVYIHKDGHHVPVRLSGVLISEEGQEFIWTSVEDVSERTADLLQEIAERRQAEKALRESETLLKNAQRIAKIGHSIWDEKENREVYASGELGSIFGLPPGGLDSNFDEHLSSVHPDDIDRVKTVNEQLHSDHSTFNVDYKIVRPDGEVRHVREIAELEFDETGEPLRTISTIQDITEQKRLEDQLRRSQKMDAIGQLTGGIAHDFNNILGIIMGNLSLLKDQIVNDENALKRVAVINKSAKRAANLTKQLLCFSRDQATDEVESDISCLILDMDSLVSRSLTPEVEVDRQLTENLWLVSINLGDFQDTLLNLVLNARDAMPNGGRLTIETHNCMLEKAYCTQHPNATPGEYVLLSVSDTGEGIASEQIDKIYDPFYTTKEVGKGTGLGLSMVFGFITRSNGHINVESEPGVGTTFHLYLPRAAERRLAGNIVDQQPEALLRGNKKILVVDDEEELLNLAKESLETLGYRVLTAENGIEALERLIEHSDISLLFSDVVMPGGMSGYELAEQAMGSRSDLKILLTSGHTEKASGQVQQKYTLIMKPYALEDLARRLQSLLGESKTASS